MNQLPNSSVCCDELSSHPEEICHAKEYMASHQDIQRTADLFRVFGDGTRARILCALMVTELCVCHLAELLGMTPSAISHQLQLLKAARIVKSRRAGKTVYYSLADNHIATIFQMAFDHVAEEQE